jgi:hypothetical protein
MKHWNSGVLALLWMSLIPAKSIAFVCAQVPESGSSGPSLSWFGRELTFVLDPDGTEDMQGNVELDILRRSFAQWGPVSVNGQIEGTPVQESEPSLRSSDLLFLEEDNGSVVGRIGYDFLSPEHNQNLVTFSDATWFDFATRTSTIALTTSTYVVPTGQILDADIEFNSAYHRFVDCALEPQCSDGDKASGLTDLQNTAVHEIGHYLGLAHTRYIEGTMYGSAQHGETHKQNLDGDARDGVVFKYPDDENNGYCDPTQLVACSCHPPRDPTHTATSAIVSDSYYEAGGCLAFPAYWWHGIIICWVFGRSYRSVSRRLM